VSDQTVAILLAAGESTRMGRPKPLLPWDGHTLVAWQIRQLLAGGAQRVVVVLGAAADAIEPLVREAGGDAVLNPDYRSGRASSVRRGALALERPAAIIILNVDQPRPGWVTRRLLEARGASQALITAPSFSGHGGHPLVLDGSLLDALMDVDEASLGLRAVTERHRSESQAVEFNNAVVVLDLNTRDQYDAALSAFRHGEWDEEVST